MNALILVIEDEKLLSKQLTKAFSQDGYDIVSAFNVEEGIKAAKRERPDLVLLDLKLPDGDGIDVLKALRNFDRHPPTIIMTAHGSVEVAVTATKLGAYDFIEKPFPVDKLKIIARNALSSLELKRNLNAAKLGKREKHGLDSFIGQSEPVMEVMNLIRRLIHTDPKNILITGETGTGKGMVARILHFNGIRADEPFVELNCAAIPENLLEAEIFGYEAGAFTDAKNAKEGLFELANRGTIFLDEIGDMVPALQAKLVKVIEEKTFRRLGGTRNITVDPVVVAASNRDLKNMVDEKLFREDLYHRLNVIKIKMPPLRERKGDVSLLAEHFVDHFNKELHRNINRIPAEVMKKLVSYSWPGNIRELRSTIERGVLLSESDELNTKYIRLEDNGMMEIDESGEEIYLKIPIKEATLPGIEEELIKRALEINEWNQTKTAEKLGVTREVLRYRMKKMGLLD